MSGRLATTVHVRDEKGEAHVFGPDDEKVPDWALGKIGAHAFEDGEHPKPSAVKKEQAKAAATAGEEAESLLDRVRKLEAENATLRKDNAKLRGEQDDDAGEFDPSDHTVDEVNDYLETADEDEHARVVEAEQGGKGRTGILDGPHSGATA